MKKQKNVTEPGDMARLKEIKEQKDMTKQKLLFFDIDGTLVKFDGKVPDSTWEALRRAREHGHLLFLCTGRCRHQIYSWLLDFGFDGIVGAAGSYVEYKGEILHHEVFGKERIQSVLDCFQDTGAGLILERKDSCVSSSFSEQLFLKVFYETTGVSDLKDLAAFSGMVTDEAVSSYPEKYADAQSMLYCRSPYRTEEVRKRLREDIHVEMASFKEPDSWSGEITIASESKETGIRKVLTHLGKDREDVIAFGDGANDIEMLKFAGTAVVMGNAEDRIRVYADYVTDPVDADGLYNAMEYLGLI